MPCLMQVVDEFFFLRTFFWLFIKNIFFSFCQLQLRIDPDGIDEERDEYENDILHDKGKIILKNEQILNISIRNFCTWIKRYE
jgi:hypothetical protein